MVQWQKKIGDLLLSEHSRWILWLPVGLGLGIGLYFSLPFEPLLVPCLVLWLSGGAFTWKVRKIPRVRWGVGIFLVVLTGFTLATFHTLRLAAPALQEQLDIREITARVDEISVLPEGSKLLLSDIAIEDMTVDETPKRVSLSLREYNPDIGTGDRVRLRAGLYPPPMPAMPGAFDFARHFYFRQIGAVGFGLKPVEKITSSHQGSFGQFVASARLSLTQRIRHAMAEPQGAIAAALITGDTAAIPKEVNDQMREAGLTHLLAVSGMNLALVAGTLFVMVRYGFAMFPFIAGRFDTKKWAAALALLGSGWYLLISGSPVSAQRAFIMMVLLLTAVLLDRTVTPMRSLAWAAVAVLIISPYSLLGSGFQLSFAATIALIAVYESGRPALHAAIGPRKLVYYVMGVILSSLVAGLATAPYTIHHFSNFSTYSLLANIMVAPLVTFWIMPAAVIALLLMPIGLDNIGFWVMEGGIKAMLWCAETVTRMPQSMLHVPPLTTWGLVLVTIGGLWLCLWQRAWRYAGLPLIMLGVATMALYDPPDIFIGEGAKRIAARMPDGTLVAIAGKTESFTAQQWLRGTGQDALDKRSDKESSALRCDKMGCILTLNQHVVAFPRMRDALEEDCRSADLLITSFFIDAAECKGPEKIFSYGKSINNNANTIWLKPEGIKWRSTWQEQGLRPWRR